MNLPVLIASLLLCLPCCLAGGACPSKIELKTCTCRHLKLKTDMTNTPDRRRRRGIPQQITMSLSSTIQSTLPSTPLLPHNNRPVTHPPETSSSPSTHNSEDLSHKTMSSEQPIIHHAHTNDGFSHTGNTVSNGQSTHHIPISDTQDSELQGRRMGNYNYHHTDDEFDDDDFPTDHPDQVPPAVSVSDDGFLSRSMGAHLRKLPERRPLSEREPPHGTFQLTVVDCKEPKTITEFEEILLFALHRRSVDKLIVSHLPPAKEETLARLPSRGMRNTRIKQFEIRDTALSGDFIWYGGPFEGQANSLLRFAANRCYLFGALTYEDPGTINTKGLHLLPHIETIDFSINHLTIVKATAFKFPPVNLSSIGLSRNSLQALEPGCFQNVTQLRIVDLSHNLLKTLTRAIFSAPARFLETINLSENFLDILPVDFFVNMPALKNVNLARNFLHNLPEKPWIIAWRQLMFIDISGNFLHCDCNLLWLLSILSPSKLNSTSTPLPSALPGQTIRGSCTYNRMPNYIPVQYSLATLTRDLLMC